MNRRDCRNDGRDPFPSSSGLSDVGVLLSKELLIDDGVEPAISRVICVSSEPRRGAVAGFSLFSHKTYEEDDREKMCGCSIAPSVSVTYGAVNRPEKQPEKQR